MMRYLPPNGTAASERSAVRTLNAGPSPPARIIAKQDMAPSFISTVAPLGTAPSNLSKASSSTSASITTLRPMVTLGGMCARLPTMVGPVLKLVRILLVGRVVVIAQPSMRATSDHHILVDDAAIHHCARPDPGVVHDHALAHHCARRYVDAGDSTERITWPRTMQPLQIMLCWMLSLRPHLCRLRVLRCWCGSPSSDRRG